MFTLKSISEALAGVMWLLPRSEDDCMNDEAMRRM